MLCTNSTYTPPQVQTSCSAGLFSNSVRLSTIYSSRMGYLLFYFILLVALNIFIALAIEFVTRYALRRPVRKIPSAQNSGSSTPDTNESFANLQIEKMNSGQRLKTKMRLLLGGMAFSILCLYIRWVVNRLNKYFCSLTIVNAARFTEP